MLKKIILLLILFLTGFANAKPLNPYVFNNDYKHLGGYYQYIEDCDHLSTEAVLQKFNTGQFKSHQPNTAFSSGISTCSYWLAVKVANQSSQYNKFLWSFYNNGLAFELYELVGNSLQFKSKSSMHLSITERLFPARSVSFPFYLNKNQSTTLFVKVSPTVSKNIYFPTDITTSEDFLLYEVDFSYLMGKYFGALLFALFVNLCMLLIIKDRLYLYSALYIQCIILFQLYDYHFDSFEISNPIFVFLSFVNKDFYMGLSVFFYAKIFGVFVNLETHFPKLYTYFKVLNYVLLLFIALILVPVFLPKTNLYLILIVNLLLNFWIYAIITSMFFIILIGIIQQKNYFLLFGISFIFLFYGFFSYLLNVLNLYYLPIIRPGNIINGLLIEVSLLTIFFVYKFKIEREKVAKKIIDTSNENYILTKKILTIESDEQERLSKNIHDEIGSDITGLRLQLENHLHKSNIGLQQQSEILENVVVLYEKVRNLSQFLKPDGFGSSLITTVENQIAFYKNNIATIEFELYTNIEKEINFDNDRQRQIFRIIKEAYTNALKHAAASKIAMQLVYENQTLLIIIEDNGIGFNINHIIYNGGIENIKSRVSFLSGKINIDSNSKGTTLIIEIPTE
jgi:signal transduction histidine kinase